jgi:hypothetical protein
MKIAGKVKSPKVMQIALIDPERILASKSGFGLSRWRPVSGFSLR